MKIFISKINFSQHPLFSEEDALAAQMLLLHKEFYVEMNQLQIPHLIDKVTTLTKQLDELKEIINPSEAIKTEIKNMRTFSEDTMTFLIKKKEILNKKANQLYSKWLELKNLRKAQGFEKHFLSIASF